MGRCFLGIAFLLCVSIGGLAERVSGDAEQVESGLGIEEPDARAKSARVSGVVTEISAQTLEISTDDGVYEFTRTKLPSGMLKSLRVGDRVSFRMKEGPESLELDRSPARLDDRATFLTRSAGVQSEASLAT